MDGMAGDAHALRKAQRRTGQGAVSTKLGHFLSLQVEEARGGIAPKMGRSVRTSAPVVRRKVSYKTQTAIK